VDALSPANGVVDRRQMIDPPNVAVNIHVGAAGFRHLISSDLEIAAVAFSSWSTAHTKIPLGIS
jgi:hypothetical protein